MGFNLGFKGLKFREGSTAQASCYMIHVWVPDAMTSRCYSFSFSTLHLRHIHVKKTNTLSLISDLTVRMCLTPCKIFEWAEFEDRTAVLKKILVLCEWHHAKWWTDIHSVHTTHQTYGTYYNIYLTISFLFPFKVLIRSSLSIFTDSENLLRTKRNWKHKNLGTTVFTAFTVFIYYLLFTVFIYCI